MMTPLIALLLLLLLLSPDPLLLHGAPQRAAAVAASELPLAPPAGPCESKVDKLLTGISKLEAQLESCRASSTSSSSALQQLLEEQKNSRRLKELLDAKDESCASRRKFLEQSHNEIVSNLEKKIALLSTETTGRAKTLADSAATLGAENDHLIAQLREERRKVKEANERVKSKTEEIEELKETLEARDSEVEALRVKLAHATRARHDFVRWLKDPSGALSTINSTLSTLDATERRLMQLRTASAEKVTAILKNYYYYKRHSDSEKVGLGDQMEEEEEDAEAARLERTSSYVSGFLLFGVLLVPFLLTFCIATRIRFSLVKFVLWGSVYAALLCLLMAALAFSALESGRPLAELRRLSRAGYDFLATALWTGYCAYAGASLALVFKQWVSMDMCSAFRLRHLIQAAVLLSMGHHLREGLTVMGALPPEGGEVENFDDAPMWGLFSLAFTGLWLTTLLFYVDRRSGKDAVAASSGASSSSSGTSTSSFWGGGPLAWLGLRSARGNGRAVVHVGTKGVKRTAGNGGSVDVISSSTTSSSSSSRRKRGGRDDEDDEEEEEEDDDEDAESHAAGGGNGSGIKGD